MTVRSTAFALAGAAAIASAPAMTTTAHVTTDSWHFMTQTATLSACNAAGKALVARHIAREFKCENDYTKSGTPVLELYTR
ncbi:MAG: hypothetical protein ACRDP6_15070 [Actinoallomurus sp.]